MNVETVIQNSLTDLIKSLDKLGIYFVDSQASIQSTQQEDPGDEVLMEELSEGRAVAMVTAVFSLGDVAWSKRVLDPALDAMEKAISDEFITEDKAIVKSYSEEIDEGWDF